MIYVYYSLTQRSFLKREANKIIKSTLTTPNEFNLAKFDAKETPIREIVDACLEVPMLENKKVVIVDDAFFLAGAKSKDKLNTDKDYDKLVKYLTNPIEETTLIFLVYVDKLDTRSKIYKALDKKANMMSVAPLKEKDWEIYTNQLVNKRALKIDAYAIKELARRTLNDRDRLLNEIDKLSLYKDETNLNDVLTLVSEPLEDKAYELSNALLKGDTAHALYVYKDLINTKASDPITLLMMLTNQFRFIYVVNYLKDNKKTISEIAQNLGANEYRVKMAYQNGRVIKNKLSKILDDIYMMDYKIKSGQVDHFVIIELFIVNFKNNYF